AAALPAGPVRDLFEGFLPADERRTLGSSPRPKAILALTGDAASGEQLFWSQKLNCSKCHRIGDQDARVGPELTTIGERRSAEELLESLLSPSLRVEPKYAAYTVHTVDGRSLAGLLVRRDEKVVKLRDGENKEITLP